MDFHERGEVGNQVSQQVLYALGSEEYRKSVAFEQIFPVEVGRISLEKRGLVFHISTAGGKDHMELVEGYRDDRLLTIEGNSNFLAIEKG